MNQGAGGRLNLRHEKTGQLYQLLAPAETQLLHPRGYYD